MLFDSSKRKNDGKAKGRTHLMRLMPLLIIMTSLIIVSLGAYLLPRSRPNLNMPFAPLVYVQTTGERYAINLQTGQRTLTTSFGNMSAPPLLPDGNWHISSWAISDPRSHETTWPLVLQNTHMQDTYLDTGRLSLGSPSWSSDSLWLVFLSHAPNCFSDPAQRLYTRLPAIPRPRAEYCMDATDTAYTELWLFNMRTGDTFPITENETAEMSAVFSPRQPQIIYGNQGNLYLFDVSTQTERLLVANAWIDTYVWSPDGLWIAFTAGHPSDPHELYIVRPDGTDLQRVAIDVLSSIHWIP